MNINASMFNMIPYIWSLKDKVYGSEIAIYTLMTKMGVECKKENLSLTWA
jgi:hypothetical protein